MIRRLLLASIIAISLWGAFAPSSRSQAISTSPSGITAQQDDPLRIVQFVDSGASIEDGGFNESTRAALRIAEERYGAVVEVKQAIDPDDRENDLISLAEAGTDIIITIGFNLQEATDNVAEQYPNVQFIGVDQFQGVVRDNVTGLIFPEDKSGFLAGVLAASLTQTGVVSGVYGTDEVPPVVAFRTGYEAGIQWAAERLGRKVSFSGTYHPGTVFDAFSDPSWGATTAAVAIEAGADVIFAAAGGTGVGALQEVAFSAENSDAPVYCIGVDTDQWLTVSEAHPCLVSSATKLITEGVVELIEAYLDGTIQGGNYAGDVGLAPFHDFEDQIPQEVLALIYIAETGLRTGAVQTCYLLDLANWHGEGEMLRIGLVTDAGLIDDGSFNESAWNALVTLEYCGAFINFIETQDSSEYASNIAEFADAEYDVIVTVGYGLAQATLEAAEAYPNIHFIGVDQFYETPQAGATGLVFHNEQAGFLAGYLAAKVSESGIIAAVLGTDQVPSVVAFNNGYQSGATYANPDIHIISTFHPGGIDTAFTDPQWGASTARQALDQGADVIFGVAGQTSNGALIEVAAAASEGTPPYCIGVDTDQWFTLPEAHPCLISSATKLIDGGVATLIVDYLNGVTHEGNYYGLVALAPYHDFADQIPAELQAELEQLALDLATGQIEISPAEE